MIYALIEEGSVIIETHFCPHAARERALEICNEWGWNVVVRTFRSFEELECFGD